MYKVYILKTDAGNIYIGHTDNLAKRLNSHNQGQNLATQSYNNWKIIYEEAFESRAMALSREKFLKTGDGKKVLKHKGILK